MAAAALHQRTQLGAGKVVRNAELGAVRLPLRSGGWHSKWPGEQVATGGRAGVLPPEHAPKGERNEPSNQ